MTSMLLPTGSGSSASGRAAVRPRGTWEILSRTANRHVHFPEKRTNLITEILRHHQAVNAAIHDADADASEVFLEDVGAMAW